MVYTKYKIEKGDEVEKEQWGVVQTKMSDYIERKFPEKADDYDVFP